ncbi:MAG TPA: inorganic phosphate transporter [Anaerolineaceae bacterium]|nr:inorganic phosphate transporter [Anaerolineaceae bacterium]
MSITLIILIVLALVFDFLNGVHDSSNVVATMISSRAIQPRTALIMTAIANFLGPFIFGVAVATTIGNDIVSADHINLFVLIAACISAIIWNVLTWILGIPSSSSHAIIGGLVGAVVMEAGFRVIILNGIIKVVIALFASPIIGFLVGILIAHLVFLFSWNASPKINGVFKKLQIITSIGLSLSHGTNDAQKTMGIITLGLMIAGVQSTFEVPFWVIVVCASAIGIGTAVGGWQLIKTLGSKFFKIRPVHGFTSQAASAIVILTASLLGGPVSTTQVVSSSIMGVGAAERMSKVRWGVAGEIMIAWLVTIPATMVVGAGCYWLIDKGIPFLVNLF